MLFGVPPLLTPDLLHSLALMGHGDEVAVVDRNYPAATKSERCHALAGATAAEALDAISRLLPLDTFVPEPVLCMAPVDAPEERPAVQVEGIKLLEQRYRREIAVTPLSRADFYERARRAFAVVATAETRPYGNFILIKGVI